MNYESDIRGDIIGDVRSFTLDLNGIGVYDSYVILLINRLKKHCVANNIEFNLIGTTSVLDDFISIMSSDSAKKGSEGKQKSQLYRYIVNIGENARNIWHKAYDLLSFMGDLFIKMLYIFVKPGSIRWKDLPFYFTRSGVDALFIVLLIVFLIGVITGYQGALQLQRFGADIFIADLIGISITHESLLS